MHKYMSYDQDVVYFIKNINNPNCTYGADNVVQAK